uniref:Uncharacterized protein n=1 Tax=Romanomermis culicivorax TaxID=13658 RepID=A0A915IZD9_ROMCU
QLLFSISSEVTVKGRITLTFRQEEKSSSPIVLQEINDLLVADIPKSLVIVVPWEMSTVEQVDLLYNRNKLLFTGGPYSWQIKALTLQDMDGVM